MLRWRTLPYSPATKSTSATDEYSRLVLKDELSSVLVPSLHNGGDRCGLAFIKDFHEPSAHSSFNITSQLDEERLTGPR